MDSLVNTLNDARTAAERARSIADNPPPPEPVDIENEFGGKLQSLAMTSKSISESLTDDGADPVSILGGLQKLVNDTDSLIVRYRKVDFDKSEEMRKRAIDIQFGQPHGVTQIIRNVCSGVYEGGNGGTCLPEVVELIGRTCDLQEDLGKMVFSASGQA